MGQEPRSEIGGAFYIVLSAMFTVLFIIFALLFGWLHV